MIRDWFNSKFETRVMQDSDKLSICCPYCELSGKSSDKKFHMGVSLVPPRNVPVPCVHCFRCGYSASIVKFISEIDNIPYKKAKTYLDRIEHKSIRDLSSILNPDTNPSVKKKHYFQQSKLPEEYNLLNHKSMVQVLAWTYAKERKLSDECIKEFAIGYCVSGLYSRRLIFPVMCEGRLVGFIARSVSTNSTIPYMFPPEFNKSGYLYNYDRALLSDTVVIVEGVFDVFTFPDNAVALFGKTMSNTQCKLISESWDNAIVLLDADASVNSYTVYKRLLAHMQCSIAKLSKGDPASTSKRDLLSSISKNAGISVLL